MQVAVSWSGGKDCCLALQLAREQGLTPAVLLCMLDAAHGYSRSNGISRHILELQAASMGLPIYFIPSTWDKYEQAIITGLQDLTRKYQILGCVFGDITGAGHREFEEHICNKAQIKCFLPLWAADTAQIKDEIIQRRIKAKLTVVKNSLTKYLSVGAEYAELNFTELYAAGIDMCGENGEFHTLVYNAPVFSFPLHLQLQQIHYLDQVELCAFAASSDIR